MKLDIEIPPPDIKTVLSSAKILANDGVSGSIDSKGDGLKRAIVFAIMRAYMELSRNDMFAADNVSKGNYLLLFEEPELYLHPKAQHILFKALGAFSKHHHVVITTHSPNFFGPDTTTTFIKLTKKNDPSIALKPFTIPQPVVLSEMNSKNQFQLICYENNNAAFFSETVVMVEGDSDYIVFPHIAKTINPEWDNITTSVMFIRIGGKSSIKRYKEFFRLFGVRILVISDLDLIIKDFDKIEPSAELQGKQSALIQLLDKTADIETLPNTPSGKKISKAQKSGTIRGLWESAKLTKEEYEAGNVEWEEFKSSVEEFFAWEKHDIRLDALMEPQNGEILKLKRELLADLRELDIYVLEKGAIESYYPDTIIKQDKPSMAQCFCSEVATKEAILDCCDDIPQSDGATCKELELICSKIFSGNPTNPIIASEKQPESEQELETEVGSPVIISDINTWNDVFQ